MTLIRADFRCSFLIYLHAIRVPSALGLAVAIAKAKSSCGPIVFLSAHFVFSAVKIFSVKPSLHY